MKLFKRIKNNKGVSLVECIVALLLFSIITGSVLTVFVSSRNSIKRQNDRYKIDLTANNILAAYEGTNTADSFESRLSDLGLTLNKSGEKVEKIIGTEGVGEYAFNAENVPMAIKYGMIVVKDGKATFRNETDTADLVSFAGDYPNNTLQKVEASDYDPNDYFNKKKTMTVSGSSLAYNGVTYDYVWKMTEDNKITFSYDNKQGDKRTVTDVAACDFDKYLFNNGYYLQPVKKDFSPSIAGTTYDYFYFRVMNAKDNTPVKNSNNKCLYYLLRVTTNDNVKNYQSTPEEFLAGTGNDTYIDFGKIKDGNGKIGYIKYCYASENTVPDESSFKTLLKNGSSYFTGKWYYYPWVAANGADEYKFFAKYFSDGAITSVLQYLIPDGKYKGSCNTLATKVPATGCIYNEYTAKAAGNNNIYYVLSEPNNTEMLVFSSDGNIIFPYKSNAQNVQNAIDDLVDSGFGINGSRNTLAIYNEKTYNKWYVRGAVPDRVVTKVVFDANQNGLSKIIFYGKPENGAEAESPFITFTYSKENYANFLNDRNSILDFNGSYSPFYKYTKKYTKTQTDITTSSVINEWKTVGDIATKLNQQDNETKKIQYYTSDWHILYYTYSYHTYNVTLNSTRSISKLNTVTSNLTVSRNGTDITSSGTQTATAAFKKSSTVNSVAYNSNNSSTTNKKTSLPNADVQNSVSKLNDYKPNTNNTNATVLADSEKEWNADGADDGTATASKALDTSGININDLSGWSCTEPGGTEPGGADLFLPSKLSSFEGKDNAYEIKLGGITVFKAHPTDFIIAAGNYSAGSADCTYDIIGGETANVKAQTYYIEKTYGDISLVAFVTYSNYTKEFTLDGVTQKYEPKIMIWSLPTSKVPGDIKKITEDSYKKYLHSSYRKG